MKNRRLVIWAMVVFTVVLCIGQRQAKSTVIFDDGDLNTINYEIWDTVEIRDRLIWPTTVHLVADGFIHGDVLVEDTSEFQVFDGGFVLAGVTVRYTSNFEIFEGGEAMGLSTYNNSVANIAGGSLNFDIWTYNFSQVNISEGGTGWLYAHNNSKIIMSGGGIGIELYAYDNSEIEISGGYIGPGGIYAYGDSQITIFGRDFNVNGLGVGYGEITASSGTLTGTLENGDPIDNDFYIDDNASIVLTPEPATLLLLGLGAVILLPMNRDRQGLRRNR